MATKAIRISISLRREGHTPKEGYFDGFAYLDSGFLAGRIDVTESQFGADELVLLTAFTLTGCPIAARCSTELVNPWRITDGSYIGRRALNLDGLFARSELRASGGAGVVDMKLSVDVHGTLPPLRSVARPFQEAIRQSSTGRLHGEFEIVFLDAMNAERRAIARTDYELAIERDVVPAWRNITILCSGGEGGFRQIEQIDMFDSKSVADLDMQDKAASLRPI